MDPKTLKPLHPKPKRPRVTNDLGVLAFGSPGRRVIMLLNQRELRRLAESSTLLLDAPRRALSIVVGIVRMHMDGLIYRAEPLSHTPGYRHMLSAIASSFAREENSRWLEVRGRTTKVRDYGPIQGLRRRGDTAYRRLLKVGGLSREQADAVMASILGAYSAKVPRDLS